MSLGSERAQQLKQQIAVWLALTKGLELPVGLSAEEASRRARELRSAALVGSISPENVVLDENFKQVLSAAVSQLRDEATEGRLAEANSLYQFICRLTWPDDTLDERQDLLVECAEIGWSEMGLTLDEVDRRRRSMEVADQGEQTIQFKPDPGRTDERTPDSIRDALQSPDVLCSILRSLREECDGSPARVADEATRVYRWLLGAGHVGLFDERDYFVGEAAFIAGGAYRLLGHRDEALRWLDRAEAGFRRTVNAARGFSSVAYARLSVRFEMGLYEDVVDLMPSLIENFVKLGMELETAKCELVFAMALKNCGNGSKALARLEAVLSNLPLDSQPAVRARILSECGDLLRLEGRLDPAMEAYQEALPLLANTGVSMARADLKMFVGGTYRAKGDFESALGAFRSAAADCKELGMATRVAYLNVLAAETLVALDRPREAEWEILQALPTIEEQKMVPEGFAAVALLRESVRRQKMDPEALRQLREHLQRQH